MATFAQLLEARGLGPTVAILAHAFEGTFGQSINSPITFRCECCDGKKYVAVKPEKEELRLINAEFYFCKRAVECSRCSGTGIEPDCDRCSNTGFYSMCYYAPHPSTECPSYPSSRRVACDKCQRHKLFDNNYASLLSVKQ